VLSSRPDAPVGRPLLARAVPPLIVAVAALAAAWPILENYFYADDFGNLVELAEHGPGSFVTAPAAGHMYIVRNTIFYLTFHFFGMQPRGYFVTALATHVANVLLLFALVRRLTSGAWAALSGVLLRPPVDHFDASRALVTTVWDRIVQQVRQAPTGSTVCLPLEPAPLAFGFPRSLGVFMLFNRSDELEGRRIRFVSRDPNLLARRDAGGRMSHLLLPEAECPERHG
jgi:hypothetical protein